MINDLWLQERSHLQLGRLRTFMDATGDGVGDFQGLMRRLDYLLASASRQFG